VFLRTPDNILQAYFGERPLRNRNTIRLVEAPLSNGKAIIASSEHLLQCR
jgi:hypothetical protein